MTVCLVMIVKNEESAIGRCLRSVEGLVDSYVICDTGSTDATVQIAESFLHGKDYVIRHDDWVDFGHNRTLSLQEAKGRADWLLLMDADMTLDADRGALFDPPTDAVDLLVTDPTDANFVYRLPALIAGDKDWCSTGVTHECLTYADGTLPESVEWDGWKLVHWCDGSRRPRKFLDDMLALQAEYARDPSNPRTVFYLAETFRSLGMNDVAISKYEERAKMVGWDEEVYYSLYQIGCLKSAHWGFAAGAEAFAECHRRFPHRAEPLRAMAFCATHIADQLPVPEGLFVDRGCYR